MGNTIYVVNFSKNYHRNTLLSKEIFSDMI